MSNSIYLDPSYGNPPTIVIDGICYVRAAPTSAPPDTSSGAGSSGCCPYTPAPCTCPGDIGTTYTINTPDDLPPYGGPYSATVTNLPGFTCAFSGALVTGAGDFTIYLRLVNLSVIGETGCAWQISISNFNDYSHLKTTGGYPTGSYEGGFSVS